VCTLASIKHSCTISIPHSVSQSACMIIILIGITSVKTIGNKLLGV
jgi:hypothetical protein